MKMHRKRLLTSYKTAHMYIWFKYNKHQHAKNTHLKPNTVPVQQRWQQQMTEVRDKK